jgi:hypothetical protein
VATGGGLQSLLAGGASALSGDGELPLARQRFEAAYLLAKQAGDTTSMAAAALGLACLWVREHRTAAESASLLARLRQTLTAVAGDSTGLEVPDDGTTRAPAVQPARCSRHGQQWRIGWGSRTAVVESSIGLLHLAVLLANPGQEIPAIELVAGVAALADGGVGTSGMSPQPLLDPAAARQYRHRLAELKAELDEPGGQARHATRAEHDWLAAELASATGFGGRSRQFTDSTERARLAAGRAIRRALARIEKADAPIGQHLRASVHTGIRCSYRPAWGHGTDWNA